MATNNNAKTTTVIGILAIVTSLFIAIMMNMVQQQAYALSKYDAPDDAANGKTNQDDIGNTAQPPITTPTLPAIPTTNCAMGTIESLESFLSCLGAK